MKYILVLIMMFISSFTYASDISIHTIFRGDKSKLLRLTEQINVQSESASLKELFDAARNECERLVEIKTQDMISKNRTIVSGACSPAYEHVGTNSKRAYAYLNIVFY